MGQLGAPARKILKDIAIEYERESFDANLVGTRKRASR